MKNYLLCCWLLYAAISITPVQARNSCPDVLTISTGDSGVPAYTRKQLVHIKKELRSRLRQLDGLYNKPFYTKEFIYTIDTRDMVLLRTRAFFMDLFEHYPQAHDTQMLLQHLGMLSSRKKH